MDKIVLREDQIRKLQERAQELGISPEELLERMIKWIAAPSKLDFKSALEYTLKKNAELYRRLA